MRSLVLSSALLSLATAFPLTENLAMCAYPNNTASAVHFMECPRNAGNQISIYEFVVKEQGKSAYPIDSKLPFTVTLRSHNKGKPITAYTFNVTIYGFKSGWGADTTCVWKEMPTFGLLSNRNGCSWGKNCPLPSGDLDMSMELNLGILSPLPSLMFSNTPIQMVITMNDNLPGSKKEEIACVAAQMRIVLMGVRLKLLLLLAAIGISSKKHTLELVGETRRNVIISNFGYGGLGTFDLNLTKYVVPDEINKLSDSGEEAEKKGVMGFSLSEGNSIFAGVTSNPHVCQLTQTDQGFNAIFFIVDLPNARLNVYRSGVGRSLRLCQDHEKCEVEDEAYEQELLKQIEDHNKKAKEAEEHSRRKRAGLFETIKNLNPFGGERKNDKEYIDYLPLTKNDNIFSTTLSIRFNETQRGKYHFIYHNCFNYHARGYSDRVAVDLSVDIVERNVESYLSAGDVPKPQLYLYMSVMFAFAGCLWLQRVCVNDRSTVFRVHWLMTALVFLKALSLFFHGVNFYFVAKYGMQREIWAVVYYLTHLLKGAVLFGTIILIGTGYTVFKNFLTERDRKVFMVVLPLQIIDNIAMIIIEESDYGNPSFQFWYEIFIFFDMLCCFSVFFPIIWSMQHLSEGARSDGKAAFNLEKLRLFRQFYLLVIAYIYSTRIITYLLQYAMPYDLEWVTAAVVEIATLFFFVMVGCKFQPQKRNPYLKLNMEDSDDDEGVAVTQPGIFDGITNRLGNKEERILIEDIPGTIGGIVDSSSDEDDAAVDRRLLRPEKTLL